MEFCYELSEEKYESYRSRQHCSELWEKELIGEVWSDLLSVQITNCGGYLAIRISVDDLVCEVAHDIPLEFSCGKDVSGISFEEFQEATEKFVDYWIRTYVSDFSITGGNSR